MSKISDISDRRALERAVVLQALVDAARTEGCNTLLLGSSASRAATDVLHAIATARGAAVQEVAAASTAVRDVKVLRPLRDIALRLIVRYARLEMPDVDWSYREQLHISRDMYGLVERFVGEVGVDNSASVHNVVRTADKLLDGREVRCMVCGGRGGLVSAECNKEQVCACRSESAICLSCRDCEQRAGKDKVNPILTLLQVRKEEERQRAGREQMRKQIADFIL